MYPTRISTIFNTQVETEPRSELRSITMINRARRDEFTALLAEMAPRKFLKLRRQG